MICAQSDDAKLLTIGTVEELERRAEALEQQARFIGADNFMCLNGMWPAYQHAMDMAHKMRARAEELASAQTR